MSRHKIVPFVDFKKHYIDRPDGFYPTDVYFHEDNDGKLQKTVMLDMVCPWRLGDGKIQFIRVPFETEEELDAIKGYLRDIQKLWVETIQRCIDRLDSSATEGG